MEGQPRREREEEEEKQPAKKVKLNEETWKDASTKEEANIDIYADRQQARVTCGANRWRYISLNQSKCIAMYREETLLHISFPILQSTPFKL